MLTFAEGQLDDIRTASDNILTKSMINYLKKKRVSDHVHHYEYFTTCAVLKPRMSVQ